MNAPVAGHRFGKAFLEEIGAPPQCLHLRFTVEAKGLLQCEAAYYTGAVVTSTRLRPKKTTSEIACKKWEVLLSAESPFRKLIEG